MKNFLVAAAAVILILTHGPDLVQQFKQAHEQKEFANIPREYIPILKALMKAAENPRYQPCSAYKYARADLRFHKGRISSHNFWLSVNGPEETENKVNDIYRRWEEGALLVTMEDRDQIVREIINTDSLKYNQLLKEQWRIDIHQAYIARDQLVIDTLRDLCQNL